MQTEFQCTKIKDGLYLGTLSTTQDFDFLAMNKFAYIINCSAQIPNYFDSHGIKYLKFKLIKERTHKLWDENLKKLKKLEKFIEEAEEQSLCCIISSAGGNNRSLVMLSAYLMSRYRWSLDKTLAYIRSKNVFIGLTESYIAQLESLQSILNAEEEKPRLSNDWKPPYSSEDEEIISKTFTNSQEMPLPDEEKKEKKQKRVSWQDKLDKEKKKESREGRLKQTGIEQFKKVKSNQKFGEEGNPCESLSTKMLRKELIESPLKKPDNMKKGKKVKNVSINKMESVEDKKNDNFVQFEQNQKEQQKPQAVKSQQGKYFTEKELIKLIKKNLKIKKEENTKSEEQLIANDKQNQQKGIYRLTINNFISPNINIMNSIPLDKPNTDKITKPPKAVKKEQKNGRAQSQKEPPSKSNNESIKNKGKASKRNTEGSPKMREKKLEKAVSLQFKKNN